MMKKFAILIICILLSFSVAYAKTNTASTNCYSNISESSDDFKFYKNYAEQVKKERAAISNALQLSEEQSKQRLNLTIKTNQCLNEKFEELYSANLNLRKLKSNTGGTEEIANQEAEINRIKREIKTIINEENKSFKKILNHEQRSKLNMINKLQRKSVKSSKHPKNYYKSNPKMRPFAPHIQSN